MIRGKNRFVAEIYQQIYHYYWLSSNVFIVEPRDEWDSDGGLVTCGDLFIFPDRLPLGNCCAAAVIAPPPDGRSTWHFNHGHLRFKTHDVLATEGALQRCCLCISTAAAAHSDGRFWC